MYENKRKHYRVAQKEIYEIPEEGIFVTKSEQQKFLLMAVFLVAFSFLCSLPLFVKSMK